MPENSRYDNDPRAWFGGASHATVQGPDDVTYTVRPLPRQRDQWVAHPSPPVEACNNNDVFFEWEAALPRFESLDEAIASVLGDPQS